jgi:hypothetical protein
VILDTPVKKAKKVIQVIQAHMVIRVQLEREGMMVAVVQ